MMYQEQFVEAHAELEAVAVASEDAFGEANRLALRARKDLAVVHARQGDHAGAVEQFEKVVAAMIRSPDLGPGHWTTLNAQAGLARNLIETTRYGEAVGLLEVAAHGLAAQLGPDHRNAVQARNSLDEARTLAGGKPRSKTWSPDCGAFVLQ